jgi:MFS family permease
MPKKHSRSQGARAPALPEGVADSDSVTTSLLAADTSAPLLKSTSVANVGTAGSLQAGATDSAGGAGNALDGLPLSAAGMLAVYTFINLLSYFDRGVLSGTLEDISADFTHVNGTQRGLLGSAFMVGYMVASPIFAHLVTKFEPFRVMAAGLFIWCCATTLCALSPSYWLVLAGRVLTGFGEASFLCIAPPFIDKFAPKGRKSVWLSVFYTAIPVGYAFGFLASGIWLGAQPLGKTWSWRAIFAFEAAAMLPFVFFSLVGKSPFSFRPEAAQPEGEGAASPTALLDGEFTDGDSGAAKAKAEADRFALGVRAIIGNKLFLFVVLGYAMQTFVTGGMAFFGLDYAKEELEMSKSASGIGFGGITVLTGILGTMTGGMILDRLRERRGIPSAAKKAAAGARGAENDGDDLALLDAHLVTAPAEAGAPDASASGFKAAHRAAGSGDAAAAVDDDAMDAVSVHARERAQNDLQNPVNVRDRIESSLIAVKLVTLMTLCALPFAAAAFLLPGKPAFLLFLFITEFFLFCCFSPLNNCIMWTVPFSLAPQALAFSVIFTHALGDALSPVVIGFLLDQTNRKWRLVMLISCTILFIAIFFWGVAFYFARDLFVAVKHFPYSRTGVSTSALAAKRKTNGQTTDASGAARPAAAGSTVPARAPAAAAGGYLDAVASAMMRADGTHVMTAPDAADDDEEHESLIGPFVYVRDKLKWSLIDRDDPNF